MASSPQMILSDGDVAGLLALRAAADGGDGPVLVWPMPGEGPEAGARMHAARQQAELLGGRLYGPGERDRAEPGLSVELVAAALAAADAGCASLVWPVTAGENNRGQDALARIAAAVDRAACVSRLVGIDYPGFEASAPYADLSDRQLADLILDMDLPIWTCWWYAADAKDPASVAAGARREHWSGVMSAAGWRGPLPGPGSKAARAL